MAAVHRWLDLNCTYGPNVDGLTNVVASVSWRLSTIDDTAKNPDGTPVESSIYGTTDLGAPNPADYVIAPTDVTAAIVRGWVNEGPGAPTGGWEAQNAAVVADKVTTLASAPGSFTVTPAA